MHAKAKLSTNQAGSVLVIVMIMLIIFAAIISTLALIILNNLRFVTSYKQSTLGFMTAESGVEQGLYYAQSARTAKTIDPTTLNERLQTITAGKTIITQAQDEELILSLAENEVNQLHLYTESYNKTLSYLTTVPDNIGSVQFSWTNNSCGDGHVNTLEISDTAWTVQEWDSETKNTAMQKTRWVYNECNNGCSFGLTRDYLYKLRLKALYCDITDLSVKALDINDSTKFVPLKETITISSVSTTGQYQQTVTANMLWRSPLNNYFDYVLFSEEKVTK
ncbi:MAG: hypothetical protein WCW27_05650 [Patescibacteria group bacterium]|jgi:hypothetical protein